MSRRSLLALAVLAPLASPPSVQDPSPRQQRMTAVETMLDGAGDASLRAFASEHLAPAYRDTFADADALLAHLRGIRTAVAPIGGVNVSIEGERVRLHVKNRERASVVAFTLEPAPPHRITEIVLESSAAPEAGIAVTWESLEKVLEEAAGRGFSGAVYAERDGKVVLDRGFGFADPERKNTIAPDTLFAIGSTPIDFTHGAVLKLEEMGKLSLDDPLSKYFDGVPEGKRGLTLEHLRTGRSGLIDFPGIEGVDANLDLSWIDRAEFLRRVFASKLLFEPGTDERHSHTAWGVLAAVVEVASGQSYDAFLREHFFVPGGMEHTGDYSFSKGFPAAGVAVGLGGNVFGEVNSPPFWGPTSWLVLGSGGMVSTPRDLARWRRLLASDQVLGERARRKYGVDGVFLGLGGNDRGFATAIGAHGGDLAIVCSNSHVAMEDFSAGVAQAVAGLGAGD